MVSTIVRSLGRNIARFGREQTGRQALVMRPSTPGSLGDQAMVDSAVATFKARGHDVTLLLQEAEETTTRTRLPITSLALPDGRRRPNRRRLETVRAVLAADAVALIGADILDGVYNVNRSLTRLNVLKLGLRLGLPCVVFGSSCSENPAPAVIDALKRMPQLRVLARDPISKERFERHLGRPIELVADIAFLLEPEARAEVGKQAVAWVRAHRDQGRKVLAVNASGHTLEQMGEQGVAGHVALLRRWLEQDAATALVLVPHDIRPAPTGDVEAMDAIHDGLAAAFPDRALLLRHPFDYWDVKALAGEVDAVLTGRMHFTIAALGMGTPALSVVYQGKFEGLMAHFDLDGLLMAPDEVLDTARALTRLEDLFARAPALRSAIAAQLPAVRALSLENFAFLDIAPRLH